MADRRKIIRVVIGKIGCDIHERGSVLLAQALRDAGMEVIYTGRYQTPKTIAKIARDEAADIIALSDHTGSMRYIAQSVIDALKEYDINQVSLVAGGLIPKHDILALEKMGVTGNYGPGTPFDTIIEHIIARANSE